MEGENTVTFTYEGNVYTATVNYEAPDTEAPVITVEGETTINLENGAEFVLPTATATDNKDEAVEVTSVITNAAGDVVEAIDTKVAGTYTVTYSAVDAAGNEAEKVVVTVVVAEAVAPEVTVASVSAINDITVEAGNNPELPTTVTGTLKAAEGEEAETVELTVEWEENAEFDNTVAGTYEFTGTVTAPEGYVLAEGLSTTVTVNVIVEELVAPKVEVATVATITETSTTITLKEKPEADLTAEDLEVTVNGEALTVTVAKQASDLTGKTYKLTYATLKGKEGNFVVNGTEKAFDFKAPEYVSTTVLDNKTVVVAFNEKIDVDTIDEIVVEKDGAQVGTQTQVLSADGKSVTIKLDTALTLADYKVVLGDGSSTQVTDVEGNGIISGAEYSFRPTQAELENVKAPAVQTAKYDTARGELTIAFDEQALTLNPEKLSINETALTGSAITVTDGTAEITLTTAQKEALASATDLTLNGLAEALVVGTGQTAIKAPAFTTEIEAVVPAKLTEAAFDEHTDVLTLTFDQEVSIAGVAKITLNDGTTSYVLKATAATIEGSKNVWEVKVDNTTTISALNALTDFAGLKVLLGEGAVAVDGIENVAVAYADAVVVNYTADTVLPTLLSASYNNATNKVTVKASEKIAGGTVTISAQNDAAGTGAVSLTFTADGTDTLTTAALTSTYLTNFEALFSKDVKLTYAENAFKDLNDNNAAKLEFANGISIAYSDFVRPEVASTPTALSAKKVQVVFNEKVSKETAEAVANYKILGADGKTPVTVTSAELLTDGVTVVLTLASDLVDGASHAIEVKNVEDVAGNLLVAYNNTITGVASTTTPLDATVKTTAVQGGKDTITVAYSAVVNPSQALNLANYYVTVTANGETEEVSLAGAEAKLNSDNQTVVITLADNVHLQSDDTAYEYTVVITGVTDINENEFAEDKNTLTATPASDTDGTGPVFDGTHIANLLDGAGNDTVTLYFDEILSADSLDKDAFEISDGTDTTAVTEVTGAWDETAKKYVVTLKTASDFDSSKTYKVTADENKVFDLAGNAIDSVNEVTLAIKDRTLPVIVPSTGVVATSVEEAADTIVVEFSKAVVKTTAENKANYVVKDAAGNVVDLTNATIAYDAATKKATITLPDGTDTTKPGVHLQFGKEYSVTAQNIVDTLGNTMVANTVKATVVGDNQVVYTVESQGGNQDITITFDEAVVLPEGVDVKDLFELSVVGEALSVIVAGTDADGNIILTISEESTIAEDDVIDVVLKEGVIILDLAGNKAADTTSTVAAPAGA